MPLSMIISKNGDLSVFVFDRIIQPLRYYYKESELIAIPK